MPQKFYKHSTAADFLYFYDVDDGHGGGHEDDDVGDGHDDGDDDDYVEDGHDDDDVEDGHDTFQSPGHRAATFPTMGTHSTILTGAPK